MLTFRNVRVGTVKRQSEGRPPQGLPRTFRREIGHVQAKAAKLRQIAV
jgi:hypothetical protein